MKSYPLQTLNEELSDLLRSADQSPILLTEATEPRYILLSLQKYPNLVQVLETLEDQIWGEAAQKAIQESDKVNSAEFMAALQQILALETEV